MKVSREKFIDAIRYLSEINKCKLKDLDLSELGTKPTLKDLDDWRLTGLNNKDFIEAWIGKEQIYCKMHKISLDLDNDTIADIAIMAHERDLTLNQFFNKALRAKIETMEEEALDKSDKS